MISAAEVIWALAAIVPLTAVGLIAGAALQRAGVSARVRERVFGFAFWLGPAACGLALVADALPQPATAGITVVLRHTPLGALSQATRAIAQAPYGHMPRVPELLLGGAGLGGALRLMRLGWAWLILLALRRRALTAPAEMVRAVRAAGVHPSIPVKLGATSTPVAAGLFKPEILLPARLAAPEAAALVCSHEAQHIRRLDNLRLALEQLACALLWFDVLRGVLHRRLLAAREERCDAAALAGCTPMQRDLYARILLEALSQPPTLALAVGLAGDGGRHAAARISAIVDPRPSRRRTALSVGLCTLLAGVGGAMAWAVSQAPQPPPNWVHTVVSAVAAIRPAPPAARRAGDAVPDHEVRREARARTRRSKLVEDDATPGRTQVAASLRRGLSESEIRGVEITVAGPPGDMDVQTAPVGILSELNLATPAGIARKDADGGVTVRYDTPVRIALHTKIANLLVDGRQAPADFDPEVAAGEWFKGVEIALGPQSLEVDWRSGNTVRSINYLTHE